MHNFDGGERIIFGDGPKGVDPTAMMMAMMNQSGGLGGNNSAIWIILLIALLRGGIGGFGLGGCGAGAAASVAAASTCQDFLSVINAIGSVKEAVAAGVCSVDTAVDTAADRVMAAGVASNANLTNQINRSTDGVLAGIANLKDITGALSAENSNRFFSVQRELDQGFAGIGSTLCTQFNALTSALNCSTNSINSNLTAGFSQMTAQNAQLLNTVTALDCKLSNEIQKTQGTVVAMGEKILCAQAKDTETILCAIANAQKDNRILELEERLHEERRRSEAEKTSNIIAINSTLQNQIGNIASALASRGVAVGPVGAA